MTRRIGASDKIAAIIRSGTRRLAVDLGGPARALNLTPPKGLFFSALPKNLYLGDSTLGENILDGRFALSSQSLDVGKQGDPWTVAAPSEPFAARLHSFGWLDDLAAIGADKKLLKKTPKLSGQAQVRARQLCDSWIQSFGAWNPYAWENEILVARVFSWFVNWQALLDADSDTPEGEARRANLYRQLKRIRSTYKRTPDGIAKLKAAACLVLGGACFGGKQDGFLDKGLDYLEDEIEQQVLADGGHVSRNPDFVVKALEILLVTESALETRGLQGSREIMRAIDRMRPMIGFFRVGSGGLFSFNGGGSNDRSRLNKLLGKPASKDKPFGYAPHAKYQRLDRNGIVLMVDVGSSPPRPYDLEAHLAPLAIELTSAAGPLIVNCGWNEQQPQHWRQAMRGTAAHSTLILGGTDAGQILTSGWSAGAIGPAISQESGPVICSRKEQDAGTWLEASHEGYHKAFGLTHCRRIYMDVTGHDIRGEDSLYVPLGATPLTRNEIPFEIRFHLHPHVKVTLAQDQKSALLIQKGGRGWRFRTDAGPLKLEKSVYLASGSRPQRSEQIVITGLAYGDGDGQTHSNRVRWSLKHLSGIKVAKS